MEIKKVVPQILILARNIILIYEITPYTTIHRRPLGVKKIKVTLSFEKKNFAFVHTFVRLERKSIRSILSILAVISRFDQHG